MFATANPSVGGFDVKSGPMKQRGEADEEKDLKKSH